MYGIIKITSYLIRQFILPNPFINLITDEGTAFIVNLIFGGILIPLSYLLTGTWYNGESKAVGSFGFLINYALLTGLFLLITFFISNIYFVLFIFIILYIILCILESKLFSNNYRI